MRKREILESGWLFRFGSSDWETVTVPHDWAINGPFAADNDYQCIQTVADGEQEAIPHYGRTGGLPHVGKAWYRRSFLVPKQDGEKVHRFEFDGIMSHATVYVNGQKAAYRPYGYSSFAVDATEFIKVGEENLLEVHVDNPPCSSRWYPGAGIYREARLLTLELEHFLYSGIHVTTESLDLNTREATVKIHTELSCEGLELRVNLMSPESKEVNGNCPDISFKLSDVKLWSPETPNLYHFQISLMKQGETLDSIDLNYGFRTVVFDANQGMSLNGKPCRMNGVCLHHDFGPLGAAFSAASMRHRIHLLKGIGCNAIRTSHNPPDPKFLELCDELGMLVIDEAFDVWKIAKVDNGYNREFDEWHVRDLTDFIRRDRNHPCVILWSTGNEILEQRCDDGWKVAKELQDLCHALDPSRPATCGLNDSGESIQRGMAQVVDIPGWNYKPHLYPDYHARLPDKPQYGSETASTVSTRGYYAFPVEEGLHTRECGQCSSYDVEFPVWASTPEKEFAFQDQCPWIMGEFVWTGFDYLGEPTPYNQHWPSHSSYFGIFDLCGLPKDRAWLYAARWGSKPVLHLLPHWNWAGREGEVTPVHVYTNHPNVELLVNGESRGVKKRVGHRVVWDAVRYEPGELTAIARDDSGRELERTTRRTAGEAAGVALTADRVGMAADGRDLVFVTVSILDAAGNPQPLAAVDITFAVEGPGVIAAVGNGDPRSLELPNQSHIRAFYGQCMVILRSSVETGRLKLTATAPGLKSDAIEIASSRY